MMNGALACNGAIASLLDVESRAASFATGDATEAEALLAQLVENSVRRWKMDEATFWQRVCFRARMIRAAGTAPNKD